MAGVIVDSSNPRSGPGGRAGVFLCGLKKVRPAPAGSRRRASGGARGAANTFAPAHEDGHTTS